MLWSQGTSVIIFPRYSAITKLSLPSNSTSCSLFSVCSDVLVVVLDTSSDGQSFFQSHRVMFQLVKCKGFQHPKLRGLTFDLACYSVVLLCLFCFWEGGNMFLKTTRPTPM